jgi:undecaprenyl-diphosphatase
MNGLILRIHREDERVLLYFVTRRFGWLDRTVSRITHLGGATITIAAAALMLASPSPAWNAAGRRAAFALAGSPLCVQLLKRSISRRRPELPVGIQSLVEAPDCFSFPSGHAAAAMSLALGAALALPTAAPWLLALGVLVGVSRCYLGVHYPGDVLAGWILTASAFVAGAWL